MSKNKELTQRLPDEPNLVHRDRVMQMLGAARYANNLRVHISAHVIEYLIEVEDQKLYLAYGYETFAEFIDGCGLAGMSKSSFYRMKDLYLKEGPEHFGYLSEWKISHQSRRLLTDGDIVVDGDDVVIGGEQRVPLGESKMIKAVIERFVREKISAEQKLKETDTRLAASEVKIEKLKKTEAEYNELQELLDHGTPYEQAHLGLMKATVVFIAEVSAMSGEEREERMGPDLYTFGEQWRQIEEAFKHGHLIYRRSD